MLTSNQRGRGHEPVTVLGRIEFLVMVKATVHAPTPDRFSVEALSGGGLDLGR
jgi:hypothetical protein